jgi:Ran GTPase-activating protein (RanGAP) involved in mRNA processing and transport
MIMNYNNIITDELVKNKSPELFESIINNLDQQSNLSNSLQIESVAFNYDSKDTDLLYKGWEIISDVLKMNTTITTIQLHFDSSRNKIWELLLLALKENKTIKYIRISNTYLDYNSCKYLEELLRVNNSINEILLTAMNMSTDGCMEIMKALKYNPSITVLTNPYCEDLIVINKITKYFERNKHNVVLKQMMLQDL